MNKMRYLTPREMKVILFLLEGWSQKQIAEHFSIKIFRVQKIKAKAMAKLRDNVFGESCEEETNEDESLEQFIHRMHEIVEGESGEICMACGHDLGIHTTAYGCARTACNCQVLKGGQA